MTNRVPSIFHLGLPKTGTTTIQYILGKDPRINLIRNRYFNTIDWWTMDWRFSKPGMINVVSEENQVLQSEGFVKFVIALSRIRRASPQALILLTIREQRSLLESRYKFNIPYYLGYYGSFQEWLASSQGLDHISTSMYYTMYKTINSFFPRDQIFFLLFEELANDYGNFFKNLYQILCIPLPSDLEVDIIKNQSLPVSELFVIKRLNKYKVFRKDTNVARAEERIIRNIAKLAGNRNKRITDFNWGDTAFFKSIEKDFAYENTKLCEENILEQGKIKKYNYLLQP